jgi:hypothetical protein
MLASRATWGCSSLSFTILRRRVWPEWSHALRSSVDVTGPPGDVPASPVPNRPAPGTGECGAVWVRGWVTTAGAPKESVPCMSLPVLAPAPASGRRRLPAAVSARRIESPVTPVSPCDPVGHRLPQFPAVSERRLWRVRRRLNRFLCVCHVRSGIERPLAAESKSDGEEHRNHFCVREDIFVGAGFPGPHSQRDSRV